MSGYTNLREADYKKSGYLLEPFKLFHLRDSSEREFSWHYHDFHKIVWFIEGDAVYHIEGKEYQLEPFDMLLVKKGEIHKPEVDFSKPYERYIIYISPEFLSDSSLEDDYLSFCFGSASESKEKCASQAALTSRQSNLAKLPPLDSSRLMDIIKKLEMSLTEKVFAGKLYSNIIFLDFMIQLNRICINCPDLFCVNARYDKKIVEIMHYINTHIDRKMTIDFFADKYFISKYHLMRKFKEETGYSLHQYILEKRLIAAKDMLLRGVPATVVAIDSGFKDYSTFHRAFKKSYWSVLRNITGFSIPVNAADLRY